MNKIDKESVRKRFSRRPDAYEQAASVQRTIAQRLGEIAREGIPGPVRTIWEAGCGTGFLTRELTGIFSPDRYYVNDLVAEAAVSVWKKYQDSGFDILPVPGDAEALPFPEGIDLLSAASVFQWFGDKPEFVRRAAAALPPGGHLLFNTFCPGNLREVRELTGRGLDYPGPGELTAMTAPFFDLLHLSRATVVQWFDDPMDVLRHLQRTGVTATGPFRWTREGLRRFDRQYRVRFGVDGKIPLTWEIIYLLAKKIG